MTKRILLLTILLATLVHQVLCGQANDTLKITFEAAEKRFTEKNLLALAGQYNVAAQRALEIQAKLYPNPFLSAELNLLNPDQNKTFDVGQKGEKVFAIDQLLLIGGKRKNEIALTRQNTLLSELELSDLLRNLKLQLRTSLFTAFFDELTISKFEGQLRFLDDIIVSYDVQARKGNIPYKEVIRLKSVYLRLNNDKTDFIKDVFEQQKTLQVMLQTQDYVSLTVNLEDWSKYDREVSMDSLLALAYAHRPDLKIAQASVDYARLNTRFQKSLGVPNVNLGASYDQHGGAFPNQVNLTLGIPFPLFNRNQGNIRFAEQQYSMAGLKNKQQQSQVYAEVTNSWLGLRRSVQEFEKAKSIYNSDFATVFRGISENFQKRNVTLLEFVDFFEAYNDTIVEFNRVQKQVALSAELVNYMVGYPLF